MDITRPEAEKRLKQTFGIDISMTNNGLLLMVFFKGIVFL